MADNEISRTENANGVPQLKPCPFCGGEAKVNTLKWMDGYTATALCKNEPNAHYLNTWDEDEAKAVERITDAWNTRAERTCGTCPEMDNPDSLIAGLLRCDVFAPERTCKCVFDGNMDGTSVCSECGGEFPQDPDRRWRLNYCPNCGARVVSE